MAMNRSPLAESVIAPKVKTIGYGFFIPLFFAYSAVILDLSALINYSGIILLLVIAIAFAKILGCGFLGSIYGFGRKEQLMIGVGMIALGEYSILVAQIALNAGALTQTVYTLVVAVVLVSIIITPILMRIVHKSRMR
jgi:Kef-type K+ transport system membrane component KefB